MPNDDNIMVKVEDTDIDEKELEREKYIHTKKEREESSLPIIIRLMQRTVSIDDGEYRFELVFFSSSSYFSRRNRNRNTSRNKNERKRAIEKDANRHQTANALMTLSMAEEEKKIEKRKKTDEYICL